MKGKYDWIDLWSAFYWMRETFPFSIFNREGALKNALLSHEVPTRGKAYLSAAYQRIEKNITADTEFSVAANTMRTSHQVPTPGKVYLSNTTVSFEAVQVDRRSFEEWIKSNAIEHSEAPTAAAKARSAKPDANYEQRATDYLIGKMETNRGMKPKDAREACAEKFPNLTDRGFERRVWPKAKAAIWKKTADTIRIKKA
jgi:hypothetical protein